MYERSAMPNSVFVCRLGRFILFFASAIWPVSSAIRGLRIASALLCQLRHSSIGLPTEVGATYYRVFFCFRQGAGV